MDGAEDRQDEHLPSEEDEAAAKRGVTVTEVVAVFLVAFYSVFRAIGSLVAKVFRAIPVPIPVKIGSLGILVAVGIGFAIEAYTHRDQSVDDDFVRAGRSTISQACGYSTSIIDEDPWGSKVDPQTGYRYESYLIHQGTTSRLAYYYPETGKVDC